MTVGALGRLRAGSTNRRILAALLTVAGLTVVVKVGATLKELVVARQFGAGDQVDAFLIAFLLPLFTIQIVATAARLALVPAYVQARLRDGEEAAERLFASAMVVATAGFVAVAALLALAGPRVLPLLGSGFSPHKLALTERLFYVLLPTVALSGMSAIWRGVLNARERFAVVALSPILTPACAIGFVLARGGAWGIYALAVGTVCGMALEAAVLAWALRRHGLPVAPRRGASAALLRPVLGQGMALVVANAFTTGALFVDQAMAASLGSGKVAALNYGNRLVGAVMEVGVLALGTAALPHLSRMVAERQWDGVRHTVRTYGRLILAVSVPFTAAVIALSRPIVSLLFERGAFTAADSTLVAHVQQAFMLQIPAYLVSTLLVQLVYATRSNRLLAGWAIAGLALDVGLNLAFMQLLGVVGIALSTASVYVGSCLFLLGVYRRRMRDVVLGGAAPQPAPADAPLHEPSAVLP